MICVLFGTSSRHLSRRRIRYNVGMTTEPHEASLVLRVSIRGLAETMNRTGGLASPYYGGVDGIDGIRAHQQYFERLKESAHVLNLQTEGTCQYRFQQEDSVLHVRGRADAWYDSADGLVLTEVKSFRGPSERLPANGADVHWAQAKLYAFILLTDKDLASLMIELAYVSIENDDVVLHRKSFSKKALETFFNKTCTAFIESTRSLRRYLVARNEANKAATFPHENLRDGQKALMRRALDTFMTKSVLLASAPTGIGKTLATLYPALKAQANAYIDRIFYLTNTTSTRSVAVSALADLRDNGFLIRALTLYAKETLCLQPDMYCDQKNCPYAVGYYDRLPEALNALYRHQAIGPDVIIPIAKQHQLCPFELSLDISRWCDVIICDYNYVFDPRVRLQRYFAEVSESMALLVDEAHNLPGRAREMYSARIMLSAFANAYTLLRSREHGPNVTDDAAKRGLVEKASSLVIDMHDKLAAVATSLTNEEETALRGFSLFDKSLDKASMVMTVDFLASRKLPGTLLSALFRVHAALGDILEAYPDWDQRQAILHLWFDIGFFMRVGSGLFDETYLLTMHKQPDGDWQLSLQCLDASSRMCASVDTNIARLYFSATLSPMMFYAPLLSAPKDDAESLTLPSPFPAKNRLVLASDACSLRFKDRQTTLPSVLQMITAAVSGKAGNYLVFVPSFKYLADLQRLANGQDPSLEWMFQTRQMNATQRTQFIKRFDTVGKKTLVAVSVLGSLFNEGIDLTGDRLIGVIVIGTGLPGISPARTLMGEYFQERLGDGFRFAYVYPGFNRVLQAAGRLIRSETDRGIILLIDDRYKRDDYQALLPEEWQTRFVGDEAEIKAHIEEFWSTVD